MSIFLSEDELVVLTGHKAISRQIQWLKENNIRFIINGAKKPVVHKIQAKEKDHEDDGLLTRKQILRRAKPVKPVCGIYFLLCGSEVVYVGQSINLIERIGNHLRNDQMLFDAFYYIEAKKEDLLILEKKYIKKLNPYLNKKKSSTGEKYSIFGHLIVE
ncbi:MAG: DUF4224 domain-containing protein [Nitrosomonas sp.]|nr:DUF4224 domain-containing protein [Nitrosomonas sp.]